MHVDQHSSGVRLLIPELAWWNNGAKLNRPIVLNFVPAKTWQSIEMGKTAIRLRVFFSKPAVHID